MAVSTAGKSIKQLTEERAALVTQAQAYHSQHEADWKDENDIAFNAMLSDASTLKAATTRLVSLQSIDLGAIEATGGTGSNIGQAQLASHGFNPDKPNRTMLVRDGRNANGTPRYREIPSGPRSSEAYHNAFEGYLRTGKTDQIDSITREANLQSDSPTQAGFLLVPEEFAAGILKEVDDLLFIRRRSKVHTMATAGSLGIRKRIGKAKTWGYGAELQVQNDDTQLSYGKKVLTPHPLTGSIRISRDLARRSMGGVESEVRSEMVRDSAELQEDKFLLGTGDREPLGVFVPSADGISTARDIVTGSLTDVTADGLLSAKYFLKQQYRRGQRGTVSWLWHRDGIGRIAKLKDAEGQYLLRVGMGVAQDGGAPEDTLLGFPVDESERSPNTFTNGSYVGLLANWSYFEIADALDMEIQTLYELHARSNEIGYIGRMKNDALPTLEEAFVRIKCGT